MSGRLVHTGQVVLDLVMRVPGLPARGGDVLAHGPELTPGGGFNVMAAAARSGARVVYAGAHGTGPLSDRARAALAAEGIAVAQEPVPDADLGMVVALVDDDGERTFVTGTGAEGRLHPGQLAGVPVTADDLVYVTGYSLMHPANRAALLPWLPTVPARILFDPGPLAAHLPRSTLTHLWPTFDIVSCNASEAHALAHTAINETATEAAADTGGAAGAIEAAAESIAARLAPAAAVVVREGASGCLLTVAGHTRRVPGFPVDPVDTNGAGDTHCGVLAAELLRGADLETACRRANAAASLSVRHPGPSTAPHRPEINALLATPRP